MAFFTTNDQLSIHYDCYGDPANQPLVLLNGYSASQVTWFLQSQRLAEAGFFVVCYDHRLHGTSDKVTFGLSAQRLAMDLRELMEKLKLAKPVLVGHSMGAAIILAYEQLFTDRDLLAVVTEDQAPLFLRDEGWLDGNGKDLAEISKFMDDFPQTKLTQKALELEVKRVLGKKMLPFDFKAGRPLLQNVITQDWRPELRQEKVPHLFLAGAKSPIFPAEHAQAALKLTSNPKSRTYIFENCGHIPHLESSEEFNTCLIDFVKSIS